MKENEKNKNTINELNEKLNNANKNNEKTQELNDQINKKKLKMKI